MSIRSCQADGWHGCLTSHASKKQDANVGTKTVDIYRNKTRESILSANETQLEDHFDTRAGKRRFLERGRRRAAMRGDAARRSAEEVEG